MLLILSMSFCKDTIQKLLKRDCLKCQKLSPSLFFFMVFLCLSCIVNPVAAQTPGNSGTDVSMRALVDSALAWNPVIRNAKLDIEKNTFEKRKSVLLYPLKVNYIRGQLNSSIIDGAFMMSQEIGSPLTWLHNSRAADYKIEIAETEAELVRRTFIAEVKVAFTEWLYYSALNELISEEKSIYDNFMNAIKMHYQLGEITLLEKSLAETKFYEISRRLEQSESELNIAENYLRQLTGVKGIITPRGDAGDLYRVTPENGDQMKYGSEKEIALERMQLGLSREEMLIEKSKFFPSFRVGYFNQEINGTGGFQGFMAGISIPLWYMPVHASVKQKKIEMLQAENEYEYLQNISEKKTEKLILELNKHYSEIRHFNLNELQTSEILIKTAIAQYENEEIGYLQYVEYMSAAFRIKADYLASVKDYNITAIQLEYYANQ